MWGGWPRVGHDWPLARGLIWRLQACMEHCCDGSRQARELTAPWAASSRAGLLGQARSSLPVTCLWTRPAAGGEGAQAAPCHHSIVLAERSVRSRWLFCLWMCSHCHLPPHHLTWPRRSRPTHSDGHRLPRSNLKNLQPQSAARGQTGLGGLGAIEGDAPGWTSSLGCPSLGKVRWPLIQATTENSPVTHPDSDPSDI